jgi:hypothetical protein
VAEKVTKRIRVSVVDFSTNEGLADRLLDWVVDRYNVQFVDRNAEYVLHSCYGYDVLQHTGVRIFLTGENLRPDFNLSDYAFGFDWLDFGDRYCRLPLYRLYRPVYERICRPRPPAGDVLAAKSGFCAFVATNIDGDPARRRIVELLSAYRRVDMGGLWMNNVGGPVGNKYAFQSRYKFAIAFENTSTPGYTTEKIADAMASNAIPIYWGDPEVVRDFNPGAFVDCTAIGSFEAAVERVRQIDQDDELCRKMLSEPWFRDGREPEHLREERFRAFLGHIFDPPLEQAFRRNRGRWGRKYERRLEEAFQRPHVQAVRYIHRALRHLRRARQPYAWRPAPMGVTADTLCNDLPLPTPRGVAGPCSAR